MKFASLAFLLVLSLTASAQTRTFRWADESCGYSSTYDARSYGAVQLANTEKLANSAGTITLWTETTAFEFSDIGKLDVGALDREYTQTLSELKKLDIVNVPYWQTFRARRIRELEQSYRLERATMLGYRDPNELLVYKDAPACTTKYALPLIRGGDDLLAAWKAYNEDFQKNNSGDPEGSRRRYEQQFLSAARMQYAFMEVINFGWFNCANALIDQVVADGKPSKEFRRLFKRTRTIRCEEP